MHFSFVALGATLGKPPQGEILYDAVSRYEGNIRKYNLWLIMPLSTSILIDY